MLKAIFKNNIAIIFALFFLIPIIVLLAMPQSSQNNYKNILENGIEVEAEIIPNSEYSNLTINNLKYYSIEYKFLDEEGTFRKGRTSTSYTHVEIKHLEFKGTIKIKYLPNTYESIESSYTPKDLGQGIITVITIILVIIDVVAWAITILIATRNIQRYRVSQTAPEYTAMVTRYDSVLRVNHEPRYRIHYIWKDESGIQHEGKSPSEYSGREAEALYYQKQINIRAKGKVSYIMSTPDYSQIEQIDRSPITNLPRNINCKYCGTTMSENATKCPNCGAGVKSEK